jgi:hypothetical protein
MGPVLREVSIKGLRKAHFDQLLSCIEHAEFYYGNKDQFKKRHDELVTWLVEILKQMER